MYPSPVAVEVLRNFQKTDANIANSFYQQYLLPMLGDVFYVLTDADHKSGEFTVYCSMFTIYVKAYILANRLQASSDAPLSAHRSCGKQSGYSTPVGRGDRH